MTFFFNFFFLLFLNVVVSGRELLVKDGGDIGQLVHSNVSGGDEDHRQEGLGKSQNSVTVAETDCEEYYSHYLHGGEGASGQKRMCGYYYG